ncbi:MAG: tetratricopeptide repeat protein [Deltaproteobacteria bacterium]|nr:tetratricopeptide repeat protein [Deltaproteobacteria bacterium]TLN04443.1 MAG: tetratricopeptide repeat protein [bacterium]
MKKKTKGSQNVQHAATRGNSGSGQPMSIASALDFARRHHQAGDLPTAESIYRQILQIDPDNPEALHLLGVSAYQQQHFETAQTLIRQALTRKPDFSDAHSNLGNVLRELGLVDEAEKSFRKAIEGNPRFSMAHYNLGNVLLSRQRFKESAESFERAISNNPRLAEAHINRGIALKELGRLKEAESSYRKALSLKPDLALVHFNLGNVLLEMGCPDQAAACYRRTLELAPGYTEARLNLGAVLRDLGKLEESAACYQQALADMPENAEVLVNYGAILRDSGKAAEAEACYRKALQLAPDTALTYFNLGNALRDLGRLTDAVDNFQRALELSPDSPAMYNNLGNTLRDLGKRDAALEVFRTALQRDPENVEAMVNLGNGLKEAGRLEEAISTYERALLLRPELPEAHYNLGTAFQDQCRMAEAVACFRKTLELKPDHTVAHSNLLMNLQYDLALSPEELLRESCAWESRQLAGIAQLPPPDTPRDPERKLRVGYVSGDLRRHPVGYFIDGVLACHDRDLFEIFCYANQSFGDDLSDRLRHNSDHWQEIFGWSDTAVTEQIRKDTIDILIDLSGHTARNRLQVFGRKPAPVQATWAGYVGTTGLSAMDYLISDPRETPEGTDHWYREAVLRLPDCYVCYAPPEYAPSVAPLPARKNGFITFGCFNNLAKINRPVIDLWIRILQEIPSARLVLATKALGDPAVSARFRKIFADGGVAGRVDFSGPVPHPELLARYGEIDLALDPFPYSGGLTTLEGLWMGVPALTLGGDRFASRHSLSHLTAAGLPEFIVTDKSAYLAKAVSLAHDLAHLENIRLGLRERMQSSPLCDAVRFTRNLEEAFRTMWRRWCEGQ